MRLRTRRVSERGYSVVNVIKKTKLYLQGQKMQNIFSLILLTAFIAESILFIILVVQGKDVDDSYFRKYKGNNLFLFTLAKASIVALVIYLILFPGGIVLGPGRFGGYIIGVLYSFVSFRFLRNSLTYYRKRV